MTAAPIRVLVADDHPVVRGGLVALLSTWDDIEVIAAVPDGQAAVREAIIGRPDVALLDLRMPVLDGVQAAQRISRDVPDCGVLVLTMLDDDESVAAALSAGARGYLLKGAEPDEIERAVRAVASGDAILSADVAGRVLARSTRPRAPVPFPRLTPREREVLDLIARGLSNGQIRERLCIASKTVGNHVSAIFLKLGVATRPEAIVMAREAGLGS